MNQQLYSKAIQNNITTVKLIPHDRLLELTKIRLHVQKVLVTERQAIAIYLATFTVSVGASVTIIR